MKIDNNQLTTTNLSIDKTGVVFFYKNRVLRGISDEYLNMVNNMFISGFIQKLIDKQLFPESWISDLEIEGYNLVIEHKNIQYWNYPYEWSFDMLKDAGLSILKINEIANKYNFELIDTHFYNIVFDGSIPKYYDLGGFRARTNNKDNWKGYIGFYDFFYVSLYLQSKGLYDTYKGLSLQGTVFHQNEFLKIKYKCFYFKYIYNIQTNLRKICLSDNENIRKKIQSKVKRKIALILKYTFKSNFSFDSIATKYKKLSLQKGISNWNNYHTNVDIYSDRFNRIITIISNNCLDATSVLELAANQGKLSERILEETHIKNLIATDYDIEAVNIMYNNNKNNKNLLPLVFDMVRTDGRIQDKHIQTRIKSDLVIALAVTHHLILTQNIPLEYILKTISKLTNKYIIIEFMPLGLVDNNFNGIVNVPNYYTVEWFRDNFTKLFDIITEERLEDNRIMFFGILCK
jgi:hypothetical protein